MALAHDLSSRPRPVTPDHRCRLIREVLVKSGLYEPGFPHPETEQANSQWRISPDPFFLSPTQVTFFESLGQQLLEFYRALNTLYLESVRGTQPSWVAAYLDQGKPEALIAYSRMKRFRQALPAVIRPDIIPTEDGLVITELDSVPGGIGLTAALSQAYASSAADAGTGDELIGGRTGLLEGFADMIRDVADDQPGCTAIVVSEEAKDYRPEMTWLAGELRERGHDVWCVSPRDVRFTEDGLWLTEPKEQRIAVLYRFFELFDLKNVPKAELVMYSVKKNAVAATPPFKPALEEKSAFALLHHPLLRGFWERDLGTTTYTALRTIMPKTWLLDPRPLPPTAVIPDLEVGGRPVSDWQSLARTTQKDRRFVIKPSGFSEWAWGSRGVSIGHDLPQEEWADCIARALESFPTTPHILQEFHKGRQFDLSYYDVGREAVVTMAGRARLSPYYFVAGGAAKLAGVLATVCPLDKKVIHGMRDAIMVPCALAPQARAVRGERSQSVGRTGSKDLAVWPHTADPRDLS